MVKDDNGEALDATEIVARHLQSLPGHTVNPVSLSDPPAEAVAAISFRFRGIQPRRADKGYFSPGGRPEPGWPPHQLDGTNHRATLRRNIVKKLILAIATILLSTAAWAGQIAGVVVQGNGDRGEFERALKLASNMHEVLQDAKFEVVIFGSAVKLLNTFSDEVPLIQKVQSEGISVIACGRSMKTEGMKASDLAPGIATVPFGAVHIVQRERQGWQYFRP